MMHAFTYDEAIGFIHGAYGRGTKNGLENMRHLLKRLESPQNMFPAVHIAGTNGKGSVCAFLQAALRCAGYKTGLYTSPFLQRYNERMRIDGIPIADEALAAITGEVAGAVDALNREGIMPTEFEIGTAIAFTYFAREGVDIAVIEVGLGGRLDPTNVIKPLVSGIAMIGLDHTRVLGDTIAQIAREKAGIIKPDTPVFLSGQNDEMVQAVVKTQSAAMHAPYFLAGRADGAHLGLPGAYQAYNAGLAADMLAWLGKNGFPALGEAEVNRGLENARWPGRLEWISGKRPILLDGAHNGQGAKALAEYVFAQQKRPVTLVCGVLQDKDWEEMVDAFARFADKVIAVKPDSHRALAAEALSDAFIQRQVDALAAESVQEALQIAMHGDDTALVVVAGSLYLVGEARTLLGAPENTLLAGE